MVIAKQPSFLTKHLLQNSHNWLAELIMWFREKSEAKSIYVLFIKDQTESIYLILLVLNRRKMSAL